MRRCKGSGLSLCKPNCVFIFCLCAVHNVPKFIIPWHQPKQELGPHFHGSSNLFSMLPPYRSTDLRLRDHPFRLPEYCTDLHKKSFIVRALYEYIKWYCTGIILLMLCFIVSLISFASYIIAKYMHDVRLSHLNKDYLLTYLSYASDVEIKVQLPSRAF